MCGGVVVVVQVVVQVVQVVQVVAAAGDSEEEEEEEAAAVAETDTKTKKETLVIYYLGWWRMLLGLLGNSSSSTGAGTGGAPRLLRDGRPVILQQLHDGGVALFLGMLRGRLALAVEIIEVLQVARLVQERVDQPQHVLLVDLPEGRRPLDKRLCEPPRPVPQLRPRGGRA